MLYYCLVVRIISCSVCECRVLHSKYSVNVGSLHRKHSVNLNEGLYTASTWCKGVQAVVCRAAC